MDERIDLRLDQEDNGGDADITKTLREIYAPPTESAYWDGLESRILSYVKAHRDAVISLIASRFKQDPKTAERSYRSLMEPGFGLAPDARFDMEGFKAVLALRAEIEGQWGGKPPAPDKYVDLSYYDRALRQLGRQRDPNEPRRSDP